MAASVNPAPTTLAGYPGQAGGKQVRVLNIAGSSAYVRGTGQTVVVPLTRSVDFVAGAFSQSGNYIVLGQPIAVGNGYKKWLLRWFYLNSSVMTEAASGDLSGETVQLLTIES